MYEYFHFLFRFIRQLKTNCPQPFVIEEKFRAFGRGALCGGPVWLRQTCVLFGGWGDREGGIPLLQCVAGELFVEAQCGSDRPAFCLVDGVTEKEAFHFYNAMGLSKQHGSLATLLARINSAELALKFCQHVFENTSQVLSQPGEREGGSLPGSIRKSTVIFQPAIFMGALFASGREYYRDDRKRLCLNGMDGFMEHQGFGQHPREFPGAFDRDPYPVLFQCNTEQPEGVL